VAEHAAIEGAVRRSTWKGVIAWIWTVLGPFLGLLLIVALFGWLTRDSGSFLSALNLRTIAVQSVIVGTAALGMTMIMIAGGIDLSVGSAVALVTVITALLVEGFTLPASFGGTSAEPFQVPGLPLALALLGGVALGSLCGLLNGLLITRLNVIPFIVTLGTMKIFRGLAKWSAGSTSVYIEESSKQPWFRRLLSTSSDPPAWLDGWLARLPEPLAAPLGEISRLAPGVWLLLGLSALTALMLNRSLLGRHAYAIGSNEATARLCGLNVPSIKLRVYALAGLLIGLAGVMQFTYLGGTGDPTTAEGLELQVIAAVVIGGGSLSGGEGKVTGTLIGVLIMSVLSNGCVHAGIPNPSQDVIIGAIIVAAVALDRIRRHQGVTT